jgi:hypothetical protein
MARKRITQSLTPVYADRDATLYRAPPGVDLSQVTMVVSGDERWYESRTYRILPPGFGAAEAHHMKILAKTRPDGLVWWVMKLENAAGEIYGSVYGDNNGWLPEAAYREAVSKCEEPLRALGLPLTPVVVTGEEWYAKACEAGRRQRGEA